MSDSRGTGSSGGGGADEREGTPGGGLASVQAGTRKLVEHCLREKDLVFLPHHITNWRKIRAVGPSYCFHI